MPMDQTLSVLAATAGAAIVRQLASTSDHESAGDVVVGLWRRTDPERVDTIVAELTQTRARLLAARRHGDERAEQDLVTEWQARLRRLLTAHPDLAPELHNQLAHEPTAPAPGGVSMTATASDQARIFQAGRDQHIGGSGA